MDTDVLQLKGGRARFAAFLDRAVEYGVTFLLIFAPLAIGGVEDWASSIIEITSFALIAACLLKRALTGFSLGSFTPHLKALLVLSMLLLLIPVVQLIPLPLSVVSALSPRTVKMYSTFMDKGGAFPALLSLYPDATYGELLKLLSYIGVFFVIIAEYRTKEKIWRCMRVIVYLGAFIAVFAVVQKILWNGRLYWIYPIRSGVWSSTDYIWGPYINHNHFAGYMEMAIPLGFGLIIHRLSKMNVPRHIGFERRLAYVSESGELGKIVKLAFATALMSATLFISLSRGGMVGFFAAVSVFVLMTRTRRSLKDKTGLFLWIGLLAVAVVFIASMGAIEARFRAVSNLGKTQRAEVWTDSVKMVKDFPALGTGFGTFKAVYPIYQTRSPRFAFEHAENDYVEALTDLGITGFGLIMAMLGVFVHAVISRWRRSRAMFAKCAGAGAVASVAAMASHGFTDFNMRIPANALLLSVIAGLAYAVVYNTGDGHGGERDGAPPVSGRAPRRAASIALALSVVAAWLIIYPVNNLRAAYYYEKASRALIALENEDPEAPAAITTENIGRYAGVEGIIRNAASFRPMRSLYYRDIAVLDLKIAKWAETMSALNEPLPAGFDGERAFFTKGMEAARQAISREPTNADYHLLLGRAYDGASNDPARSEAEMKRALAAWPINAERRFSIAMHYLLTGRLGDAIEQARILAEIDDSYVIADSVRKRLFMESRSPEYLGILYQSYLFKALEITWRASHDAEAVKGITPPTADAKEVLDQYLYWKGLK